MPTHLEFVYSLAVLALWLAPLALLLVWLSSRAMVRLRARAPQSLRLSNRQA